MARKPIPTTERQSMSEAGISAVTDVLDTAFSAEQTQLPWRQFCESVAKGALRASGYPAEVERKEKRIKELKASLAQASANYDRQMRQKHVTHDHLLQARADASRLREALTEIRDACEPEDPIFGVAAGALVLGGECDGGL